MAKNTNAPPTITIVSVGNPNISMHHCAMLTYNRLELSLLSYSSMEVFES